MPHALYDDLSADDQTRATYAGLMRGSRHAYISTYCQHGEHDDCKRSCKCCDAPCLCINCLHPVPPPALPLPVLDDPEDFAEAGQAFADAVQGDVTATVAARVLSMLAGSGLIVSVRYHEETSSAGPEGDAMAADLADILDDGADW